MKQTTQKPNKLYNLKKKIHKKYTLKYSETLEMIKISKNTNDIPKWEWSNVKTE